MAYTTIKKPSDYFNTVLYTGNGVDDRSITGVGFQPDFTWIKSRTTTDYHTLFDVVRGVGKRIFSNVTEAEDTTPDSLQAFESDGFEVGTNSGINGNTFNFVSWNWKANGAGSANTAGSINSTVSANTTSGFSVVSYTGTGANATVGHGLGVAPKMILIKNTIDAVAWEVGHDAIGWTKKLRLNATDAEAVDSGAFNNTAPTSSVFSLGTNNTSNDSGDSMIAYCFAEKQGYSKFGSYTGNGNADGTFVYTGFKPAFVMCKASSVGGSVGYAWSMFDNKRSSYNIERSQLEANTSDAQQTDASGDIDLLSNGFKFRSSASENNQSGATYIYMAFAEAPLVGTNNIPANAR